MLVAYFQLNQCLLSQSNIANSVDLLDWKPKYFSYIIFCLPIKIMTFCLFIKIMTCVEIIFSNILIIIERIDTGL